MHFSHNNTWELIDKVMRISSIYLYLFWQISISCYVQMNKKVQS